MVLTERSEEYRNTETRMENLQREKIGIFHPSWKYSTYRDGEKENAGITEERTYRNEKYSI